MRIVITGGAGFIGSHLTDHLVKRGDEVTVVDNLSTGRKSNIDQLVEEDKIRFFYEDISDPRAVQGIFKDVEPEVVIHAAASYKNPDDWWSDVSTNCVGTVNIVKASEEQKIKRLIYFNTSLTYGLHPVEHPITTNCPINPSGSSYAISKTAAEHYIGLSKLNYISFRLANHYGERNLSGPFTNFYQRLSQGKKCFVVDSRRDFVYVGDLIRVVLRAVDGEGSDNIYHISSGTDYSILEVYQTIREAMGLQKDDEIEIRPRGEDDAKTLLIDPYKTQSHFPGWKVETPLAVGIQRHIDWCKKNTITETYTHVRGVK